MTFRASQYLAVSAVVLLMGPGAGASPAANATPKRLSKVRPETVGMSSRHLARIDAVVAQGLKDRLMPGCVVAVGHRGKLVFLKAYGHRCLHPEKALMTVDTLFDMASITKPVATATSIMILVDQGRLHVGDAVATYLPEFGQNGKDKITVEQLLVHQGGLIPDNKLADYQDGPDKALEHIYALSPFAEPGTTFRYSDVGYIVLGELVRRVTGQDVHQFSQANLFVPLGMGRTGYLPIESLRRRAAATEQRGKQWLCGEVHDPRAHLLGGIAGHAGLFSTAQDLAVYAQMMLGKGTYEQATILGTASVEMMTTPRAVSSGRRGLGFDMGTGYSSNRGENFSAAAFGHGGFTGTSMWIDPVLDLFVIFLSNRVHMEPDKSVNRLAGRIGTIAAAAIGRAESTVAPTTGQVLTGIDVLARDGFKALKGRRVGLISNHTGVDRQGHRTVDLLHAAPAVELLALFSPEHGFAGTLDRPGIADSTEEATGLPIYSLYGKSRIPSDESLAGLDTLVFDIQDIGARFYTYPATMGNAMRAAAKHKIRFVVLDRPNPIGGLITAGPVLDAGRESFVGYHRLPVQHGMTIGELALMFNEELGIGCDLHVVRMEGWQRTDFFEATGLWWINPSPNMRNLTEAILYPGIGLLETTNLSVGRGTDTPFEVFGAPWIDGQRLAAALNRLALPGVGFIPIRFTPTSSKHEKVLCGGINVHLTDRSAFQPVRTGLAIATVLRRLYPDDWQVDAYTRLLGNQAVLDAIKAGAGLGEIERLFQPELGAFRVRRQRYLLYR